MRVGRVEHSWAHNCLAIGLTQGFLEPLEATALHIVQATVEAFIHAFGVGIADRYEGIRNYIVAHYRLSESLKSVMTCWFTGGDLIAEVDRLGIAGYYSALSWGCLLAG